jgi:hypothetical protein
MRRPVPSLSALCLAGGLLLALTPRPAVACVIDNTASAYANGVRATLTTTGASPGALWAPFTFGQAVAAAAPVRLDESRADLLRSLDSSTVAAPYRWTFGDGTGAALGHVVTHRYARPGLYLIGVEGFDEQTRRWFPFDKALLRVVPSGQVIQSNLGYYGLRALDVVMTAAGWVVDAALALLVLAAVVARRRSSRGRRQRPMSAP